MISFQEVSDFYLKYKDKPTKKGWEKFGNSVNGWFTLQLGENIDNAGEFAKWVSQNEYFVECLINWIEGNGVIMTREGQIFIIVEETPLMADNIKDPDVASISQTDWNIDALVKLGFYSIENLESKAPITELPEDFSVVDGAWFDDDNDWGYTDWSRFMSNTIGATDDEVADLPIYFAFLPKDFTSLLNWKTTESLRNLFGL
tara:strand:- start:3 stop:608 length:606 start_codon:yes stop_codon:yes gene_type:complete